MCLIVSRVTKCLRMGTSKLLTKKKIGCTFLLVIGISRSKQQQNTKVMPRLLPRQKKKIEREKFLEISLILGSMLHDMP